MRLFAGIIVRGFGDGGRPFPRRVARGAGRSPVHGLITADRRAKGAVAAISGLAELNRQLAEQVLLKKIATRLADLALQRLRESEVLKKRNNIGESLVKGGHVWIAPKMIAAMQSVQQGMGGFVRDDIMRNGAKHFAPGKHGSGIAVERVEIAEHK